MCADLVRAAGATKGLSPARRAAFDVLLLVDAGRGHSDELLHGRHLRRLSDADKNLATALVMGVLRWQIALDAMLRKFLEKPDAVLAPAVACALRLGAFQLLHMDRIPAHAALSESVELVRYGNAPYAAGMVNAVLRKVATAPKAGQRLHESTAAFAERLGHPAWIAERWVKTYGRSAAIAMCEAGQQEPGCATLFAAELDGRTMPVMDDGSRLVAELAAIAGSGAKRVWDCCAAPGGKTLVLARRLAGAEILATDASPRRLEGLRERLQREGAEHVRCEVADAATGSAALGEFDLVLCDVPCSGTGTLARNPEIRHRLEPSEISRQAARQREILTAALERLAPGGKLVYATCSMEPEENERVVDAVMNTALGREVKRVNVAPLLDRVVMTANVAARLAAARDGALRTLPGMPFAADGFYAAVLRRR